MNKLQTRIANDPVILHGDWCLSQMIHQPNIDRVRSIMDARRGEIEKEMRANG